ncbi:XAP5-domain-containing protein [Gonapodya prolifera JEL478]|uniref:XAP5-domain-containing protein n=1 Tax=Gonapodya prolifera (strain JEL478) TaxID=1344416 RepID=A0A139A486_GONPJ|nr:XAP5-domain-containing protein [Gonapodya prolifera JEL478]|eukprot:KXS11489.1 XAP5-domain-containing protein [Gonapodya prolifera JEL478]
MMDNFAAQKQKIEKDTTVRIGSDKFVALSDSAEAELKRQTVGLVHLADFQRIRAGIENKGKPEPAAGDKKRKKAFKPKVALSFSLDGEEEEGGGDGEGEAGNGDSETSAKPAKKAKKDENEDAENATPKFKLGKNPHVDTSFLPDRAREERDRLERERLAEEWVRDQERIKGESIVVTYSYWDGSGHRKGVECKKGDSIAQFLEKVRQQWHQLRGVNVDNLMFIKEDLIIPHHYTFYDFILNKSRGKSGPLFSFDVRDDVRLVLDASVETEEAHAGKVVERVWYERNKHIFPASRWEVFDPEKDYGKYTIKDLQKEAEASTVRAR